MNQSFATPESSPPKLNLAMLLALVVGSMIGSGIFNLPQNMAAKAGAGAILMGWLITGVGMLLLCSVYQTLAMKKPNLNNGVYAYARAFAGEFIGFNSAWGYWVSAWLGNVSYLMAMFAALGYFFPIFGEGNTLPALLGASLTLWTVHFFILRGIKGAAFLNAVITFAKILPLLFFIIIIIPAFQVKIFSFNFWGHTSFFEQIKSTMLVTVWVFIGIEGASVYSARAKNRQDIGKATFIGFGITLLLLMMVSLLSLGILSQTELSSLKNLSMASVIDKVIGRTGGMVMVLGLLISAGGALLAWTLLAAEALFTPASEQLMPLYFAKENKNHVPTHTLWLTNGLIQIFLVIILFSKATYLAMISLATSMILIPYLLSAVYAIQVSKKSGLKEKIIAWLACGYCCWLLYAAGLKYLFLSALLYMPGAIFYIIAKRQQQKILFKPFEKIIVSIIILFALTAIGLLSFGKLTI